MALTTPALLSVGSFDATEQYIFQFSAEGGDLIVSNELHITDITTDTTSVIYDQTQTTYKLEHILAANILTNGHKYQVKIKTYTNGGGSSSWSDNITFYCYTEPTLEFTNIPQTAIDATQFEFKVKYTQIENEMLKYYIFNLYNSSNDIISTSGTIGNNLPAISTILNYTFNGFDNTTYKIECIGYTATENVITTGMTSFIVNYESTHTDVLELTNNCNDGYIGIQTNIDIIKYTLNPQPAVYTGDKEVDLVKNNAILSYVDNFEIGDDFTLRLWLRDVQYDNTVYTITFDVGSQGTEQIPNATTNFNGYLFQLPIPKHSASYTFSGWYDANNNAIAENKVYTGNTTIYAHYTSV